MALSGDSLRQTVHTHRACVHQAVKLVATVLRVARVTAGLAESNSSLPPGLWLTLPAGWLPRTGICSGTLRLVTEYGLPLHFLAKNKPVKFTCLLAYKTRFLIRRLRWGGGSSRGRKDITQKLHFSWNRNPMALNFVWSRREYRQIALNRLNTAGKTITGRVLNRHLATVHFSTSIAFKMYENPCVKPTLFSGCLDFFTAEIVMLLSVLFVFDEST